MASALEAFLLHVFGAKSLLSVYIQRAFFILLLCCFPLSALWFYTGEFLRFTGQDPLFVVLAEAFIRVNLINFLLNVFEEVIRRLLTCIHNRNDISMIFKALVIIIPIMFKSLIKTLGRIGMSVRMSPFYFATLFVSICEVLFRYRTFAGMSNAPLRYICLPSLLIFFYLDTKTSFMQALPAMVPIGLNIALCVRIGNAFDAKDRPTFWQPVSSSIAMLFFLVLLDFLLMWLIPVAVPHFAPNSAEIIQKYAEYTPAVCFHIFDGIMCIYNGAVQFLGYPLYGIFFIVIVYVFAVPYGLFASFMCSFDIKSQCIGPAMGLCLADMLYISVRQQKSFHLEKT